MKKINKLILGFVAIMLLFMTGCCLSGKKTYVSSSNPELGTFYIATIDSCEYIKSGYNFSHKGNCKYCAERQEKLLIKVLNEKYKK